MIPYCLWFTWSMWIVGQGGGSRNHNLMLPKQAVCLWQYTLIFGTQRWLRSIVRRLSVVRFSIKLSGHNSLRNTRRSIEIFQSTNFCSLTAISAVNSFHTLLDRLPLVIVIFRWRPGPLLARFPSTLVLNWLSVCLIVVTLHESQREHPTGYSFSDCSSRVPPHCLVDQHGSAPCLNACKALVLTINTPSPLFFYLLWRPVAVSIRWFLLDREVWFHFINEAYLVSCRSFDLLSLGWRPSRHASCVTGWISSTASIVQSRRSCYKLWC